MRKPFIAGNWKMYKTIKQCKLFADEFIMLYNNAKVTADSADTALCVPYLQIPAMKDLFNGTGIAIGAQNMHYEDSGAFTGEISPIMLREIGTDCCIIGHSERRQYFGETDEACSLKIRKALQAGFRPIYCVGENLEQREEGKAFDVVDSQLAGGLSGLPSSDMEKTVIAYEPVWAIGTGKTATSAQAEEMAKHIRDTIRQLAGSCADNVIIQYGGSVKPANIAEIMSMENIDGALVGGASLNPQDFIKIINYQEANQ